MKQNYINNSIVNLDKIINQKLDEIILSIKINIVKQDNLEQIFANLYAYIYSCVIDWIQINLNNINVDKIINNLNDLIIRIINSCL